MANPEHLEQFQRGVSEWNAWRGDHPEIRPDLSGIKVHRGWYPKVNLSDANLQRADFQFCLFSEADFSRSDLRDALLRNTHSINARFDGARLSRIGPQANFTHSSFVGASLEEGDLAEANFFRANLAEARVTGCNFMRANLRRIHLENAFFKNCSFHEAFLVSPFLDDARIDQCTFGQTVIAGADLSALASFEEARHDGPSHVMDSLELTAEGLRARVYRLGPVEAFLRGAGIQEEYLDTFRYSIQKPIEFYSCFISYSHSDVAFATRLYNDLQMRGIRCWLDKHELLPGDDIYASLDRGIRLWDKILLCCSRSALNSWWVGREIDTAFEKEQRLHKERGESVLAIIPIDLDGHLFDEWNGSHAAALRKRLAARFEGWDSDVSLYEQQLDRVIKALHANAAERTKPPDSKL